MSDIVDPCCADCGDPFGEGRLRAMTGSGVGVVGRLHVRCHARIYEALRRAERRKTDRPPGVRQPKPAAAPAGYRHARVGSGKQAAAPGPREAPVPLDAVARIESGTPAEVCRQIARATRGVFPRAGADAGRAG